MKTEKVSIIFDRKKTEEKKGYGSVDIRIYLSSTERKFFTLGKATSATWQEVANRKDVVAQMEKYKQILAAMEVLNEPMTIAKFCEHAGIVVDAPKTVAPAKKETTAPIMKETTTRKMETTLQKKEKKAARKPRVAAKGKDFIEFIINEVEKEDIAHGTRKHRLVMIAALQRYGKMRYYSDLTPANVLDFDAWLHDGTRSDVSIFCNYHKRVHHFIRLLKMRGEIFNDPYEQVQLKHGKCKERQPLTEEELLLLRNAELSDKLDRVRDMFVFSAYTGLAYCDMAKFKFQDDAEKVGDLYYINSSRLKTGTKFFTPILKPAMDVLEKYNYQLPIISNQKMNDYLKLIQIHLNIHKKLTCHVARHSFATLALAHDVPIENVAKMLGHTDIKTTQIYAKVLKTTIERHSLSLANTIA